MKRSLLILSPYFPYPPHDGGRVRMFNLISRLSATNDVHLLSYADAPPLPEHAARLESLCRSVRLIPRDRGAGPAPGLPRSPGFFYTREMADAVERAVAGIRPDIVHIEFLVMAQYARHAGGAPVVYTEHDISNIDFEKSVHDRDLPEKLRYVEWLRLVEFERSLLPSFSAVIAVTERDRDILREFAPGVRVEVVPTGVDTEYFKPRTDVTGAPGRELVFVGHYRHYPNLDAVRYFAEEILPSVARSLPDVRFSVVGSGLDGVTPLSPDRRVRVTGQVDDVLPHLHAADVFVAPVRLGGGIKGKILEAMAAGVPVVASAESAAGIRCRDGRDIVIAVDAGDFARKTVEFLRDPERRARIAREARRLAVEQYDWKMVARRLDECYDGVAGGASRRDRGDA